MGHKIRISPLSYITAALSLLVVPARWCLGAALAAFIHELSHLTAIYLTGGQVMGLRIRVLGAKIEALPGSRGREALWAGAGPLGSLIFAFSASFFPEACLCALVQGLYNLLPVYPLDGGRLLYALLPEPACKGIEIFAMIMLLGLGTWCSISADLGILPLIPGVMVVWKGIERKFPCKEPQIAVQ